jgi:hypothetical protein
VAKFVAAKSYEEKQTKKKADGQTFTYITWIHPPTLLKLAAICVTGIHTVTKIQLNNYT